MHYCKADDFEQIYPLLKQLWPRNNFQKEKLREIFVASIDRDHHVYINYKYKGNKIVGFCSMSIKRNLTQQGALAQIEELVVDEKYRKKGIGKKLITEIVLIARFRGCKRIELDAHFDSKKAHQFYEDLGFENRAYIFSKPL